MFKTLEQLIKASIPLMGITCVPSAVSSLVIELVAYTAQYGIVATANKVNTLPPEFLRKGRFDEIFFVDLPNDEERREILTIHLTHHNLSPSEESLDFLVDKTVDFNGAELAYLVTETLTLAYSCGRQGRASGDRQGRTSGKRRPSLKDFQTILSEIIPQAQRDYQGIQEIRSWAKQLARSAS